MRPDNEDSALGRLIAAVRERMPAATREEIVTAAALQFAADHDYDAARELAAMSLSGVIRLFRWKVAQR